MDKEKVISSGLVGDRIFLTKDTGEASAETVLRYRDALEHFITSGLPGQHLKKLASAGLTAIVGVAPSSTAGIPLWKGSVPRALSYMLLTLAGGVVMIVAGGPLAKLLGALAVVSAMRNFTSSVGHHLTHSTAQLPWPGQWTRAGYNALSALFLLSSFEEYRKAHGVHHGKVAGAEDPDQQFIEYVRARLTGWLPFVSTLLDPRFHARFLKARLNASIGSGPAWRRVLAAAGIFGVFVLPTAAVATWFATLIVGYQTASMLSWLSLHLWGARPASGRPAEIATAVTYGRLLLPEASYRGLALLTVCGLVRVLWLQGDLVNHDLHHLWQGPWTEAPYVRTRLLLEGAPIRQTINVRNMFRVAFEAAANTRARRAEMSDSGMRTM